MTNQEAEPEFLSLDFIRAELDLEVASQEKRADSADTRAGLILGFVGVLAATVFVAKSWLAIFGLAAAGIAALYAMRVMRPKLRRNINPRALRKRYAAAPEQVTRQSVLDTRLEDYEINKAFADKKIDDLKAALRWLGVSVVLVLIGATLAIIIELLNGSA